MESSLRALNISVVSPKDQTCAQMAIRFNPYGQNNIEEGWIWIINKSTLVNRHGEIKVCDSCDDS